MMFLCSILLLLSCSNLNFNNSNKFIKCQKTLSEQLMDSSENGDIEKIRELISRGANVNTVNRNDGETPLIKAIFSSSENRDACALLLIGAGADVNKSCEGEYGSGEYLEIPLNVAVYQHQYIVVKALIDAGAHTNKVDGYGKTPLMHAEHKKEYLNEKLLNEDSNKEEIESLIEKNREIIELLQV